jgi:hypothetical protein
LCQQNQKHMPTAYVIGLFKITVDRKTGDQMLPSVAQIMEDMQCLHSGRKYMVLDLCTNLGTVSGKTEYQIKKRAAQLAAKHLIRKYELFYINN